jgi:putative membrane protein
MKILIKFLILAGAVLLASYVVPGIAVAGFATALIVALVLGLINLVIKPIIKILTLPITILTLGLFGLVINTILFWFVSYVVAGFDVSNFIAAFWGALVVAVVMWVADKIF